MPFTFRKRFRLGPLFVNLGKAGVTSWGLKVGRLTRNFTYLVCPFGGRGEPWRSQPIQENPVVGTVKQLGDGAAHASHRPRMSEPAQPVQSAPSLET
jgi:hypothetical protein